MEIIVFTINISVIYIYIHKLSNLELLTLVATRLPLEGTAIFNSNYF